MGKKRVLFFFLMLSVTLFFFLPSYGQQDEEELWLLKNLTSLSEVQRMAAENGLRLRASVSNQAVTQWLSWLKQRYRDSSVVPEEAWDVIRRARFFTRLPAEPFLSLIEEGYWELLALYAWVCHANGLDDKGKVIQRFKVAKGTRAKALYAFCLSWFGYPDVRKFLVRLIQERNDDVALVALWALSHYGIAAPQRQIIQAARKHLKDFPLFAYAVRGLMFKNGCANPTDELGVPFVSREHVVQAFPYKTTKTYVHLYADTTAWTEQLAGLVKEASDFALFCRQILGLKKPRPPIKVAAVSSWAKMMALNGFLWRSTPVAYNDSFDWVDLLISQKDGKLNQTETLLHLLDGIATAVVVRSLAEGPTYNWLPSALSNALVFKWYREKKHSLPPWLRARHAISESVAAVDVLSRLSDRRAATLVLHPVRRHFVCRIAGVFLAWLSEQKPQVWGKLKGAILQNANTDAEKLVSMLANTVRENKASVASWLKQLAKETRGQ